MRRALPLALLVLLTACRHGERRWSEADWARYVAHLEARRTEQGSAFPADSLARLGLIYSAHGPTPALRRDTAKGHGMLRLAMAQGSREAPFTLALLTNDSLRQRALMRVALRRGESRAVAWLALPFAYAHRPMRADSLVLLAREARRHGAHEGADGIGRQLATLDSLASLGHRQADSLRADLKRKGLWEDRFAASL